jgi:catechol 2,3-dioxygenase-like lactoylglutathione lyase family enzyme
VSALRGLVEVVLTVADVERSLTFYRDVLRLELISPPQVPAKFLRIGEPSDGIPKQIVLVPASTQESEPKGRALHHIGLEVAPADYQSEHDRINALGFDLRYGKHPFMPVDAFYLDDPDGNEIEIATWRGAS